MYDGPAMALVGRGEEKIQWVGEEKRRKEKGEKEGERGVMKINPFCYYNLTFDLNFFFFL